MVLAKNLPKIRILISPHLNNVTIISMCLLDIEKSPEILVKEE
jgi:hypothetical protein